MSALSLLSMKHELYLQNALHIVFMKLPFSRRSGPGRVARTIFLNLVDIYCVKRVSKDDRASKCVNNLGLCEPFTPKTSASEYPNRKPGWFFYRDFTSDFRLSFVRSAANVREPVGKQLSQIMALSIVIFRDEYGH